MRGCKIYGGKAEKPLKSGGKPEKDQKICGKPEKRSLPETGESYFKSRKAGKTIRYTIVFQIDEQFFFCKN